MDAVFTTGNGKFNFRVAGVLTADNKVLLHKAEGDPFWALPGGRVKVSEKSQDALEREMHEETGMKMKAGTILWMVENFFDYEGETFHEIGFYYRMTLISPLAKEVSFNGIETGRKLIYRWFPIEQLDDIDVKPAFLRTALGSLPEQPGHIVIDDR
ncbi:NUDIX hydrolase [Alteribacter lacisalsi]|uniref:NUDIX hydrolase n=1 Tax=Alteribacter lacisalsi TaxID=2045244 RepID=A0A2W0H627_9BACI|nr:NUDIX hydrolase [Alteribacter lacisalsi]PYZ95570.1 NUDIX hydrolase [Alteribacter lacisalsi]